MPSQYEQDREACRAAHHGPGFPQWIRYQKTDASIAYAYYCGVCRGITHEAYNVGGSWVSKATAARLSGQDPDAFPLIQNHIRYTLCLRCRETKVCQIHHIAPRKLFRDADSWPQIPLCQQCHSEWHAVVTPGLCTSYNAEQHVQSLTGYLHPKHLESLRNALTAHLEFTAL